MNKPYVYIHTHTSIDGNIYRMDLKEFEEGADIYRNIGFDESSSMKVTGNISGKTSSEDNITFYETPDLDPNAPKVAEGDYIANDQAPMYYVSIDPRGELAFTINEFTYREDTQHILQVLTEQASNSYKAFLRNLEISYIIVGEKEIDYQLMLEKLYEKFGMERVLVSGGGTLNWSFVQQDLVDEISVVLPPIANGDPDAPRLFMAKEPYSTIEPTAFKLKAVEVIEEDHLWIRYVKK